MYRVHIDGFPEQGDLLELPNIAELLFTPMFNSIDIDDLRKHGTDFHRYLIDQCPIRGNHKYISIDSSVQFLNPDKASLGSRYRKGHIHEWHIDGIKRIADHPGVFHLLMTNCSSLTAFNVKPLTFDLEENRGIREFGIMLNDRQEELGLAGQRMRPNRFIAFTNHIHTSRPATQHEFRFTFRITESDIIEPLPLNESMIDRTYIYGVDGDISTMALNILNDKDGIIIYK